MVHSDRVGPGVLVVGRGDPSELESFALALNEEGFTVLVPDLLRVEQENVQRVALAGAEHLTANWHPRLGLVSLPGAGSVARGVVDAVAPDAWLQYDESVADQAADFLTFHLS